MADAEQSPEETTEERARMKAVSRVEALRFAQDPLENETRKKLIEDQLDEVDLAQFLFQGFIQQKIPLALPVTFRSMTTRHSLWVERVLAEVAQGESVLYANHYGQVLQLAASIFSIGEGADEKVLPDLWQLEDEPDFPAYRKRLDERVKTLGKLPTPITDDLGTNLGWFQRRIRLRLSTVGLADVKN